MARTTLGVIVGNRGFFPDHLVEKGHGIIRNILKKAGLDCVILGPKDTHFGGVETLEDARKCAALFKKNADKIDGVLVTLPNFGDERAVANTLRFSGLDVPVLIHAFADDPAKMDLKNRRDSFCGKLSVCNNLVQYGIPFTLTTLHTVDPETPDFMEDLLDFAATCRVVKGLKKTRVGAVGARTGPFNTVRYSEKILESRGITVETLDLSEVFGLTEKIKKSDGDYKKKIASIKGYVSCSGVPEFALDRMARFGLVLDRWMKDNALVGCAIQCWTSLEENFGIVPCSVMSMMSEGLVPAACEVDVLGLLSMYAAVLASGKPSALVDWNNNYGDDPDKAMLFHCSNFPASLFESPKMSYQDIIAKSVGKEKSWGTCIGNLKATPATFVRLTTDDSMGEIRGYLAEGEVTSDPPNSFGGVGVVRVDGLQDLLAYACENGFEHHCALNPTHCADPIYEAMDKYLDWDVYMHE
ncbi:MAG TPA: L-fucose/L-arabinose isomerase family protein [Candidatus Brocadiia bacterium]|nr:L-fucose/L-arabinose isomerase family protein [Candidatus Brocadiia bacterium]